MNATSVRLFETPSNPSNTVKAFERLHLKWGSDGRPRRANVRLTEDDALGAIKAAKELSKLGDYDAAPLEFEQRATEICRRHLPCVIAAIEIVTGLQFPLLTISGLPAPSDGIATPADGMVDPNAIKAQIGFLAGLLAAPRNRGGFAYRTENRGRLLRAVVPTRSQAGKSSSQGFKNDLGWHNDNANQWMAHEPRVAGSDGLMNPEQAFVAVRPVSSVPMEILFINDVIAEAQLKFGSSTVEALKHPEFAVRWPDSHELGGEVAITGVPLLVDDAFGDIHSRFHAENVFGLTCSAREALDQLRSVVMFTAAINDIHSGPGDIVLYSNTRVLHRRRKFEPKFDGRDRFYARLYLAPLPILDGGRIRD